MKRECRGAEGALSGDATDQPVRPAASGTIVRLVLTIDDVEAASGRVDGWSVHNSRDHGDILLLVFKRSRSLFPGQV